MSRNDASPAPTAPIAQPKRPFGVAFWLGLAVLIVGVIVAVLGVRTAVASYERGQDLAHYAEASGEAHQAASVGAEAVAIGQQLLALHQSMAEAAPDLRQVLLDGDEHDFTSEAREFNQDNHRVGELRAEMVVFAKELGRTPADGSFAPPSATPDAPASAEPPIVAPGTDVPISTVCLDVEGTFEGQPVTIDRIEEAGALTPRLEYRGLTVAAAGMPCDAQLTIRFDGTAQGTDYDKTATDKWLLIPDRLYTGAKITGTLALAVGDQPPVSVKWSLKSPPDEHVTDAMFDNMARPTDALVHLRLWLDEGLTKLGLAER